jgi:redox-sensitive bicupin YhaK (pirin superfamily)
MVTRTDGGFYVLPVAFVEIDAKGGLMQSEADLRAPDRPGQSRQIAHRTRGKSSGPFTRLVSPSDIGRLIKPFVFLDYVALDSSSPTELPLHPHSGIATLTTLLQGSLHIQDSKGLPKSLHAGAIEWMQAGRGVWHGGPLDTTGPVKLYQLWVALPPGLELGDSSEIFPQADDIPEDGPARILLGSLNGQESPLGDSLHMTYLHVRLSAGERWRYTPPHGHDVLWISVYSGSLDAGEPVSEGDLIVFDQSGRGVDFIARESCGFVLGSAVQSPYDLVEGYYSVHTNAAALQSGEQEIARMGAKMCEDGRLTLERAAQVARQMLAAAPGAPR